MSQFSYSQPSALVETAWLAEHLNDPLLRVVESNEDVLLYDTGHIPGAVHIDWHQDLNDPVVRDYIQPSKFADLNSRHGIDPETTIVFYGDKSNWWAAYALWVYRLFGHSNVKILNGGRDKWIAEKRPLTQVHRRYRPTQYPVPPRRRDDEIRAFRDEVHIHSLNRKPLIDVRSPGEFRGEVTHMPEYPQEGVLRGGHIPGATSIPWKTAVNPDGTFKSPDDLRNIYEPAIRDADHSIVYCRIGERSSHTWFVLHYLLGVPGVRNYDGSWTEWGNSVRLPIARGDS
jgi:thiosulfate/3-mercaptopyruvate sulfurtransferase